MFHGTKLCLVVVFLLFLLSSVESREFNANNSIRVLLGNFSSPNIKAENLKVNGQHFGWNGIWEWNLSCGKSSQGSFIRLGEKIFYSSLFLESVGSFISLDSTNYRGIFHIYERQGKCVVVNHLDIEEYLPGVLGKEMASSWPIEALKAQSVAARSYALYKKRKEKSHSHYDISSSIKDQAYGGQSSESRSIREAVISTQGIVLTFKDGLMQAFYHSNCGGKTNVPLDVWGKKHPAYKSVLCPTHFSSSQKEWVYRTNLQDLEYKLRKKAVIPKNFLRLAKLSKLKEEPNKLLLADVSGKKLRIPSSSLRSSVGFDEIRSTKFAIQRGKEKKISFYGRGYGHAVGMCQYGARAMALDNKNYQYILKHYYPLTFLRKVY